MLSLVLVAALSQAPLAADTPLPPNHPAVGGQPPLPPNHPPVPGGKAADTEASTPDTGELVKRLDQMENLKDKEKSFEVAASLGRLYYAHGRYSEAATYLGQAMEKAAAARTQYLQWRKAVGAKPIPAAASIGCAPAPNDELEKRLTAAREKAKTDVAGAAGCLRAALHPLIEVETELGNVRFMMHDSKGALATFDSALDLFDSNPEARYGRAAVRLDTSGDDLNALKSAKADFELFLHDYPTSPRAKSAKQMLDRTDAAIAAGGIGKLAAQPPKAAAEPAPFAHPPTLTKEMVDAVQNTERTPELEAGFVKLMEEAEGFLAAGKFQEALDNYKRVVPFNPDNGRAKAGMAWSLVKLNKQPMADNVWRVASADPASIDALGDTLKAKGDAAGARAVWEKLKQTAPAYAGKLEGKLR